MDAIVSVPELILFTTSEGHFDIKTCRSPELYMYLGLRMRSSQMSETSFVMIWLILFPISQ